MGATPLPRKRSTRCTAMASSSVWKVAGGRWRFGGYSDMDLSKADAESSILRHEESASGFNSQWKVSGGRWCYASDMISSGTHEPSLAVNAQVLETSMESPF